MRRHAFRTLPDIYAIVAVVWLLRTLANETPMFALMAPPIRFNRRAALADSIDRHANPRAAAGYSRPISHLPRPGRRQFDTSVLDRTNRTKLQE